MKKEKEKGLPYVCSKCKHRMTYEEYLLKGCRICQLEEKKNAS